MDPLNYAVGDIHGRHDLLVEALRWIERHSRGKPSNVVFLGDYIDRGPSSRSVVETLMRGPTLPDQTFTCLMGNHEEMLLLARSDNRSLEHWLENGGDATLDSYAGSVPDEHAEWISSLPLLCEDEHRYFVHAGMNPKVAVDDQTPDDLLWIREPFLSSDFAFPKHVVHGHTPNQNGPELRGHRTNLDVGAYWTGRLCVGVFSPKRAGGPTETTLITSAWTELTPYHP